MPIIWRYLTSQFLKVFSLTTFSFIVILLISRLKEIAKFAALGPESGYILLFILYLIPYILPIVIPVACLISATLLAGRLSHAHEITVLRSLGFSLRHILFPILFTAFLLSCINFYVVSEMTTHSHMSSRRLVHKLTSINPLFLLQNRNLLKQRDIFIDMSSLERGRVAEDVIIIALDSNHRKLTMLNTEKLELKKDELIGTNMAIISPLMTNDKSEHFDNLVIENQELIQMNAGDLTQLLKKSGWRVSNDYFKLPLLLIKIEELKQQLNKATNETDIKWAQMHLDRCYSEVCRRISCALSVFTFTLLGLSFGISIGRQRKKKGILMIIGLSVFALICFFGAKSLEQHFYLAATIYFIPHIILALLSIRALNNISKGIEA